MLVELVIVVFVVITVMGMLVLVLPQVVSGSGWVCLEQCAIWEG